MRALYLLLLLYPLLEAKDFFITPEEYAEQLYYNPRGIGCHSCHGGKGEGKVIARFKEKQEQRSFVGPPIDIISYEDFYMALNSRKRGMPRYFLTDREIQVLYSYLHQTSENNSSADK